MKQSIIKITLCAFIISAAALAYTHQDVCETGVVRFTSFCRDEESTQQDNSGGSGVDYSNVYANNDNPYLYGKENNHSGATVTTNDYAITDIPTENFISSNESIVSDPMIYSVNDNSNEFGPNNNYQEVASISISNGKISTSNQSGEMKHASSVSSSTNNVDEAPKEIEPVVISSVAPPPPGGGGQDPYSVPFDDFYGLVILLIASAIFGVLKSKKIV